MGNLVERFNLKLTNIMRYASTPQRINASTPQRLNTPMRQFGSEARL